MSERPYGKGTGRGATSEPTTPGEGREGAVGLLQGLVVGEEGPGFWPLRRPPGSPHSCYTGSRGDTGDTDKVPQQIPGGGGFVQPAAPQPAWPDPTPGRSLSKPLIHTFIPTPAPCPEASALFCTHCFRMSLFPPISVSRSSPLGGGHFSGT